MFAVQEHSSLFCFSGAVLPTSQSDTVKLHRECEDIRAVHGKRPPLPLTRGIRGRPPERGVFEQFPSLVPRGQRDRSTSVLIGSRRATAMKHSFCDHVFEVSCWPLSLSFPWEGQFNQRIQWSLCPPEAQSLPHGSTTETSQKSIKSLPEGFTEGLSKDTVWRRAALV